MKASSIGYLLTEGFKNVWKNCMMSLASIGILLLCLLLTGASLLLSININKALSTIESKNIVKVFLDLDVDEEKAVSIGENIRALENVQACDFYSKTQAAESFKERLGAAFENFKDDNPLPNAYNVTLKDISKYSETAAQIENIAGVESISNKADLFEKLTQFDRFVSMFGIIFVIILALISLFIISNTIRLTMYSRRFEISIMKSVGATDWFVRIPFMVEGMIIGIISACIASFILKFSYDFIIDVVRKNISFFHVSFDNISLPLFVSFLLAGVGFGLAAGLISISKYLRKEGGEILGW